jgi:hypothetical protein
LLTDKVVVPRQVTAGSSESELAQRFLDNVRQLLEEAKGGAGPADEEEEQLKVRDKRSSIRPLFLYTKAG